MTTEQTISQRLDTFEKHLLKQQECLEDLAKSVDRIHLGIQGNREHDQPGYKDRIARLETSVENLTEFKKKIQYTTSAIAFTFSFGVNAAVYIIQKLL